MNEKDMLSHFVKIAEKHGYHPIMGQGKENRIFLEGNLYFQFGDLRVDTPFHHIIIEAETAGGVNNLVKYWYCLQKLSKNQNIIKPIVLLHIFNTNSKNDYGSHLILWDDLWSRMEKDLGVSMKARRFKIGKIDELSEAIDYFEKTILLGKSHEQMNSQKKVVVDDSVFLRI